MLIGSTRRGRSLAPRLAQKLEAGSVTEALGLAVHEGRLVARRYSLGGNTVREVAVTSPKAVIAVAPGTFEAAPADVKVDGAVVRVPITLTASRARVVQHKKKQVGAANIEQADRVVCVGRGVEKREDLQIIEALAKALDGELAGTRPLAYEFGWIPEDRMIGISGKAVRPQLYVAVGLSGQIQHSASIRGSKIILASQQGQERPDLRHGGLRDRGRPVRRGAAADASPATGPLRQADSRGGRAPRPDTGRGAFRAGRVHSEGGGFRPRHRPDGRSRPS